MRDEVAVDGDGDAVDVHRLDLEPGRVDVPWRLIGAASSQEDDVGHDPRAFLLEGVRRQADGSQEIRPVGEELADSCILLIEREVTRDQGQDSARPQGVRGLRKEEVMEREPLPPVGELHIGKGRVPDDGVDGAFGKIRVREALNPDVLVGMKGFGDAAGDAVQLDADKPHPFRGLAHEVPDAAAGLQDGGIGPHAEA